MSNPEHGNDEILNKEDVYELSEMPTREMLVDFLRKGSGLRPKYTGGVYYDIEKRVFMITPKPQSQD